ncbi:unnamed protein product, partial [Alternaria alternata]
MSSRQEHQECRPRKRIRRSTNESPGNTARPPSHYEPLDPTLKEIRVLDVAPGIGDAIVECTMRRISLRHKFVPIYETISYCWGAPRPPSTIKLNGHLTSVPASSEAAIRRMRLSGRPRTLWIDAICIDQSSVIERSDQVAFMSTVYCGGIRNLIYLGEDGGMARRGVKAVQDVFTDMRTETANLTLLHQTIYAEGTGARLVSKEGFSKGVDFEALEVLFSLAWFRRLWVLQEIVLATSNTCHWGSFEFDLLDTVRAAKWLNYKSPFITQDLYDCIGARCATEMFELLDRDNGHSSNHRALSTMLSRAKRFEKTEAGDSVYAILGLIDQDKTLGGDETALLEVNYMKSLRDVLRDATRYALCEDNNLQVLRDINHQVEILADSQTFPTWSARADLQHLPQDAHWLPNQYRAYEGLEAPSLLSDVSFEKNVLLLQGIVVDQVVQTTVVCHNNIYYEDEEYHQWLGSVKDMTIDHRNITMQENIDLAIASTLVAGKAKTGEEAQPNDLKVLVEYIKSLAIREDGIVSDGVNIRPPVNMEKMTATLDT